jgi:ribonuclease-3
MILNANLAELKGRLEELDCEQIYSMYPGSERKIAALEAIQGYNYQSKKVALVSLIHRSALVYWPGLADNSVQSNERLEFLGDAIIGLFVAVESMNVHPKLDEGALTRLRSAIAGTENLSAKSAALGLGRCLVLGKGESLSGGHRRTNLLADAFEAATAALFIDAGEDRAWNWLRGVFGADFLTAELTLADFDAKTRFQQWTQSIIGVPPTYRVVGTNSTPETTEFIMAGFIGDVELARSRGRNKREASKQVAALMQAMVDSGNLTENRLKEIYGA